MCFRHCTVHCVQCVAPARPLSVARSLWATKLAELHSYTHKIDRCAKTYSVGGWSSQYSYCSLRDCFGFPDLVKKRRVGSPSVLVQANTSCSQESTHSHECAPFLSEQFAICACMCCVFSPPACAHHAVSYASLFPPLSRVFTSSLPSHPRCSSHRPLSLDLSWQLCWKRFWL